MRVAKGTRLTVEGQEVIVSSIRRAGDKFSIVCSPVDTDRGESR